MKPPHATLLQGIQQEFAGAKLGDARLNSRLELIAERVAAAPSTSFPKVVKSTAELEGLYRFLSNDDVGWEAIAEPHLSATAGRCGAHGPVRVVHDTTDFVFAGDREGLGVVMKNAKGFFLHAALAVSGDESRTPLGVVGWIPYVRSASARKMTVLNEHKLHVRTKPRAEKESSRWELLAAEAAERLPIRDVVHVMDQEADDYAAMAALVQRGLRFVIRGSSKRVIEGNTGPNVADALATAQDAVLREVPLSKRPPGRSRKEQKSHPARDARLAKLHVRWTSIRLEKPQHAQADVEALNLQVVQVFEPDPPNGEVAIEWTLFTTDTVTNLDEATAIVDHYRARWRIEEYFKALKTGCAFQERQLTTLDALLATLSLLIPVAWQLLLIRSLGRDTEAPAATVVFTLDELEMLRVIAKHDRNHTLTDTPTVRDAMLAIAALGGHIKNNGDPGWLVLGRGYEDFLRASAIWRLARKM